VPVVTEPSKPAGPRPVPHEELDPDVRAIVDDLYQQARAELSGNDLAFFAPIDDYPEAPIAPAHDPAPPAVERIAPVETTAAPIVNEPIAPSTPPIAPVAPVAPVAPPTPEPPASTARGGWVPAFTPNERRRRHTSD
jgi:hypothetical protein